MEQQERIPENAHPVNQAAKKALAALGVASTSEEHYGFQLVRWAVEDAGFPWRPAIRYDLEDAIMAYTPLSSATKQFLIVANEERKEQYHGQDLPTDPAELAQHLAESMLITLRAHPPGLWHPEGEPDDERVEEEEPPDYLGTPITHLRGREVEFLRQLAKPKLRHRALWVAVGDYQSDLIGAVMLRVPDQLEAQDSSALGLTLLQVVKQLVPRNVLNPPVVSLLFAEQSSCTHTETPQTFDRMLGQAIGIMYGYDPDFRAVHLGCYVVTGYDITRLEDEIMWIPPRVLASSPS